MTDDPPPHPALLPSGLRDLLPPEAETEAVSVSALMAVFAAHGYRRVKPPLIEFEDGLLTGAGAATADQTFRLMDPNTRRMMGLRADMTPQVARIAATRLAGQPRPLRLSYAGQCLRVHANHLAPDRQIAQAGIELIGVDSPAADAEIILLAAEALDAVGLTRISIDLTMPPLAPALLDEAGIAGPDRAGLTRALDRKDTAAVSRYAGPAAALLNDLLLVAGPAGPALDVLRAAQLGPASAALRERMERTVAHVRERAPALRLTLDPLEFRGFRYHTGLCLTVFAQDRAEELGRGGRYLSGEQEPATGLTLFPDAVLRACPPPPSRASVFLPWDSAPAAGVRLRAQGFATLSALDGNADPVQEAQRLGCTHILQDGKPVPLSPET